MFFSGKDYIRLIEGVCHIANNQSSDQLKESYILSTIDQLKDQLKYRLGLIIP